MRLLFVLFTFLFISLNSSSQIVINEIMAANASTMLETDYYNFADWIELFNQGTSTLILSNYYISDDENELQKWLLPTAYLHEGEYYLVYCDKEASGRHTNFSLSTDGEVLYLSDKAGNILNQVEYRKQFTDISYGRDPLHQDSWAYCQKPTPGAENVVTLAVAQSPAANYSVQAGRLSAAASLVLNGSSVKYSTNGSIPNAFALTYVNPLNIQSTSVIKSTNFQDYFLPSKTYASTYFVNEHAFTLPVVSLSYNPDYFNDNTYGIYVTGTNGIQQIGNCPGIANFNQNWERTAYLEYFDENGEKQISQTVGVKIAGGCTRFFAQKSLSVYARSKYGNNDLDYPFFKQKPEINSYKSILLRNSGNDFNASHLRDAFLQTLVSNSIDLDYQSYQPVITYFNGQYCGIMNVREKVDEDYFLSNYALSSDSIDFVEGNLKSVSDNYSAIRGTLTDWDELISFVASNSLADNDNYDYVVSKLDLQEYLNYMAFQIYIANTDWPGNNLKFWKRKTDGKWRWIVFDTDFGFGATSSSHNTIDFAVATNGDIWPNPPWSTLLFRKLLENETFKKEFIRTILTLRNTCFQPDWCNYVMDSLSQRIDFEMTYHKARYGGTKNDWYNNINRLKQFAAARYNFIPGYIGSYFSLNGDQVNVSVDNPAENKGDVAVNHLVIEHYPFSMMTYKEISLSVEALPAKGYQFSHWNYGSQALMKYLIQQESEWSYLDEAGGYPAGWTELSFDDSAWPKGPAQLGYGDGDENTVISYGSDPNNKIPAALFRKVFTMPDTAGMTDFELGLNADDGAIVYLNGQEIFRNNMPTGAVAFNTYASGAITNENTFVYTSVDRQLFQPGDNVIACEVHQANATSSDISFDISISYILDEDAEAGIFSHNALILSDTSYNISIEPVFTPVDKINGIYLNEIVSAGSPFKDDFGEKSGFVELYNSNGSDIALYSFFISDDRNNLTRYAVPDSTIIPAGGFIIFYLDGDAKQGKLHTSFKADPDGESFYLSQKTGENLQISDSVAFAYLTEDHSFGRYPDGNGDWHYLDLLTPNGPNDDEIIMFMNEISELNRDITVFPNPTNGMVNINIAGENAEMQKFYIDVTDISGKILYPKSQLDNNSNHCLNLDFLDEGLYIVRIYIDRQLVSAKKLIILR